MATLKQREFVADIESGVSALISENCPTNSISLVLDRAGYKLADFSPYVHRLAMSGDWELLERLAAAFLRVGLTPLCLTRALEQSPKSKAVPKLSDLDSEPLKLESVIAVNDGEMISPEPQTEPLNHWSPPIQRQAASKAWIQLQEILDPLNPIIQKKIVTAAMGWYEVGG
jgi:hypothetical protein